MDLNIALRLLNSENPFTWKLHDDIETVPENMIEKLNDQISEKEFDAGIQYELIAIHIVLCYEYFISGNVEKAKELLERCEKLLSELKKDTKEHRMHDAAQHIFLGTKTNVLMKENNEEAIKAASEIPEISEMNHKNKAAVHGIKGVIYGEYGILGSHCAIKFMNKALEIDPDESLWLFLKAKYFSRIRRAEKPFDAPRSEEVELFEKALEMNRNPSYMVFTAQTYRESASRMYSHHSCNINTNISDQIKKLNEKSLKLYKEALSLRPNCSHMMFRCAKGLIMLPRPYRHENLAEELLKKAIELAPDSSYGNHVMAQYYERVKKDLPSALERLKIAEKKKNFGAAMDRLRLEYRILPKNSEVITTLKRYYDEYPETERRCQILSQLTSFYILKESDLLNACDCVKKVLRLKPECVPFLEHRPFGFFAIEKFNLYDLVIDEVLMALRDKYIPNNCRRIYNELMDELGGADISVQLNQINFKNKILDAAKSHYTDFKKNVPRKNNIGRSSAFQNPDRSIGGQVGSCKNMYLGKQNKTENNFNFRRGESDGTDTLFPHLKSGKAHSNVHKTWRTSNQRINHQFGNKKKNQDNGMKQMRGQNDGWRKPIPAVNVDKRINNKTKNDEPKQQPENMTKTAGVCDVPFENKKEPENLSQTQEISSKDEKKVSKTVQRSSQDKRQVYNTQEKPSRDKRKVDLKPQNYRHNYSKKSHKNDEVQSEDSDVDFKSRRNHVKDKNYFSGGEFDSDENRTRSKGKTRKYLRNSSYDLESSSRSSSDYESKGKQTSRNHSPRRNKDSSYKNENRIKGEKEHRHENDRSKKDRSQKERRYEDGETKDRGQEDNAEYERGKSDRHLKDKDRRDNSKYKYRDDCRRYDDSDSDRSNDRSRKHHSEYKHKKSDRRSKNKDGRDCSKYKYRGECGRYDESDTDHSNDRSRKHHTEYEHKESERYFKDRTRKGCSKYRYDDSDSNHDTNRRYDDHSDRYSKDEHRKDRRGYDRDRTKNQRKDHKDVSDNSDEYSHSSHRKNRACKESDPNYYVIDEQIKKSRSRVVDDDDDQLLKSMKSLTTGFKPTRLPF